MQVLTGRAESGRGPITDPKGPMQQKDHRFYAMLILVVAIAFMAFIIIGLRACDEKATVTCPDGTKVEYSSHGSDYQSGADAIGNTLCK